MIEEGGGSRVAAEEFGGGKGSDVVGASTGGERQAKSRGEAGWEVADQW